MEENVIDKNNKKKLFIIIFIIIVIAIIGWIFVVRNFENNCETISNKHKILQYNIHMENSTFLEIGESDSTEYEIIESYTSYQKIKKDFKKYMSSLEDDKGDLDEDLLKIEKEFDNIKYDEEFFEKNNIILIEALAYGQVMHSAEFEEMSKNGSELNVWISFDASGVVAGKDCVLYFIEVKKADMEEIEFLNVDVTNEGKSAPGVVYKPIIYLYPESNTNVSVKLENSEKLLCSYPLYKDNGWEVNAEPNGMLTYLESGRKLYSLYYESENIVDFNIEEDGFVIKGEDTASFLEEKLEILGLSEIESEEFIIYWLPILEANKYNYIRFATMDEINKNMGLDIQPKPDSIIRVLMTFKGLEDPISVKEQKLVKTIREGFVAVEWGGTEIK